MGKPYLEGVVDKVFLGGVVEYGAVQHLPVRHLHDVAGGGVYLGVVDGYLPHLPFHIPYPHVVSHHERPRNHDVQSSQEVSHRLGGGKAYSCPCEGGEPHKPLHPPHRDAEEETPSPEPR